MRILLTILFVVFATLGGYAMEKCEATTKTKVNYDFAADNQLSSFETIQVNIYVDQDSNESNNISLFFTEIMLLPKPTCLDANSVTLPHRSFYHILLSNLLIDLPPPTISELF